MKTLQIFVFAFLSTILVVSCRPEAQVNQIIDDPEDLLAVESDAGIGQTSQNIVESNVVTGQTSQNEVDPYLIPIEAPPPGFPGERLTSGPKPSSEQDSSHMNVGNPDGSYSFSYLSKDGTTRDESGVGGVRQTGGWEYVGPDGKIYSVRFVADENGFRPVGDHLPQPPALPPALQRFEDAKIGLRHNQRPSEPFVSAQAREEGFEPEPAKERLLESSPAVVEIKPDFKPDFETFRPSVENFRSSGDRTRTPIRFDTERLPKSGKNIVFRPL